MSVVASDMKLKYSVAAAAGNTTAGNAATSLGDQVSTTEMLTTLGGLFDDVTSAEATAGDTEYRCIFVCNDHATDTAVNVTVAVQSQVAGGATFDVALDAAGVTARGAATAQAATVANENTAPVGAGAFGASTGVIASMGPLTVQGVWVRRIVTAATAAIAADGGTLRIAGEG